MYKTDKLMEQNIKELYGTELAASDGDIGHVKDFYFDDKNWVVRYLVADTGSWLIGRLVLLTPHSFGKFTHSEKTLQKTLQIKLRKMQIESSPSIDTHLPVSRQYEIEYYGYYGWSPYWDGGGMWGIGNYPMVLPLLKDELKAHEKHKHREDKHLRSTLAVTGYHIQSVDSEIGHVSGFLVDDKSWAITELVIETGHWYSGKEILISPNKVERISYDESKVFVTLTKADIQQTVEHKVSEHVL
jgi:hypothetical protein